MQSRVGFICKSKQRQTLSTKCSQYDLNVNTTVSSDETEARCDNIDLNDKQHAYVACGWGQKAVSLTVV